ncbi:TetR/AcrR family transcriptional regulator [uncultured Pseudodesulfovibrio sp.]|uniref:TetR/AcrR family transcriptional regulator n=1 Tax=uncultured Pseudodesulfovibrio sp. TaxID=2035858 RepID=UPI0029C93B6C|nr:TetR/AcrR family transcriptional regulator [uncultured Pseudodesulfovibrio sp.]
MAKAQYDRNCILDRSIELFWEHGFNGSSMKQLVQATGLKPGSLYLSFGNKEAIYREAMQRYAEKGILSIREILDTAPSVGEGLCRILEMYVQEATKKDYCSCFLVKTQLELSAVGNTLHDFAAAKLREVEAVYQNYLEKEFSNAVSTVRATSLMLHIFGMRVYGYQQGSTDRMRRGLKEGLPWLPWTDEA